MPHIKVIELLLDRGADVNHLSNSGWTDLIHTADDMELIKNHKDEIFKACSDAEKIAVLINLIAVAVGQEDTNFIKENIQHLSVKQIRALIDTKDFSIRKKIDLCSKLLKSKTKITALTEICLDKLWSAADGKLAKLKASYGKISDVLGSYISKKKLTKDPVQKIASYLIDDSLEKVCEAVPYRYAMQILKYPLQKCLAIYNKADDAGVDSDTLLLGVQEN